VNQINPVSFQKAFKTFPLVNALHSFPYFLVFVNGGAGLMQKPNSLERVGYGPGDGACHQARQQMVNICVALGLGQLLILPTHLF
jgi:hypothetical protein